VTPAAGPQLAIVHWDGGFGGAEAVTATLAREWRRSGVDVRVVLITRGGDLVARLDEYGVPHTLLGLRRGRDVLAHPRLLARAVSAAGADGALIVDPGYLSAVLRAGGYRGPIVGAEHGKLLMAAALPRARRIKDRLERVVGAPFRQVDVGVSDFIVREMRRYPHARRIARIYNGVDTRAFSPGPQVSAPPDRVRAGCAARMVPGKGIDDLLRASALLGDAGVWVRVAGDGPERPELERLLAELDVRRFVELVGAVPRMPEFWRSCDVAVIPSNQWVESFSMSTLEAMACGVPVVATDVGGIPEVLVDGETGTIVPPGRPEALAAAIRRYAEDPGLRQRHGRAGAERARRWFSIETAAAGYLELFAGSAA
jgi:L-malate glycosyltransferase